MSHATETIARMKNILQGLIGLARKGGDTNIQLIEEQIELLTTCMTELGNVPDSELAPLQNELIGLIATFTEFRTAMEATKLATRGKMGELMSQLKANKLYGAK